VFFQSETFSVAVHSAIGISEISKVTRASLANLDEPPGAVGIVVDADDRSASVVWNEILAEMHEFDFGRAPGQPGVSEPKAGVFVLPNNEDHGTLETILLKCGEKVYPQLIAGARAWIEPLDPEDNTIYWYERNYAPLMPSIVKENMWMRTPDAQEIQKAIDWMIANKLEMQVWYAYLEAIRLEQMTVNDSYEISVNDQTVDIERWDYLIRNHSGGFWAANGAENSNIYKGLAMLMDVKITTQSYKLGIERYDAKVANLRDRLSRNKVSGINTLFQYLMDTI
jgi:hypothetical protein